MLGGTHEELFTLDCDIPELEAQLTRGGRGEMGSAYVTLLGAEVFTPTPLAPTREGQER
jgi:hypothetical protein